MDLIFSRLIGTLKNTFKFGKVTLDASGVATVRNLVVPDKAGTLAIIEDFENYSWTAAFKTPPASANASGSSGTVLWGSDGYLYLCIATDTWIRTQLTTWS